MTYYNTETNIDAEVTRRAHIKLEIVIENHQNIGHRFVANRYDIMCYRPAGCCQMMHLPSEEGP